MTNHYPSKITSVRLSEAAITRAYELSPHLSKAVIKGLVVLQTQKNDRPVASIIAAGRFVITIQQHIEKKVHHVHLISEIITIFAAISIQLCSI